LDRCDWLDRKHTIFGKITGESIFNLLKLGDIETDNDDRPVDSPPKIISVEALWNPFDDIVPRQVSKESELTSIEESSKENKKKTVNKLNLLSFGDEAEEEQKVLAAVKEKIKSSHDVLNDPRLLKGGSETVELDPLESKRKKEIQSSVREARTVKKNDALNEEDGKALSDSNSWRR
jgi:peptidyl-prolyl cis-trans isomerase SDCCAG10